MKCVHEEPLHHLAFHLTSLSSSPLPKSSQLLRVCPMFLRLFSHSPKPANYTDLKSCSLKLSAYATDYRGLSYSTKIHVIHVRVLETGAIDSVIRFWRQHFFP